MVNKKIKYNTSVITVQYIILTKINNTLDYLIELVQF